MYPIQGGLPRDRPRPGAAVRRGDAAHAGPPRPDRPRAGRQAQGQRRHAARRPARGARVAAVPPRQTRQRGQTHARSLRRKIIYQYKRRYLGSVSYIVIGIFIGIYR